MRTNIPSLPLSFLWLPPTYAGGIDGGESATYIIEYTCFMLHSYCTANEVTSSHESHDVNIPDTTPPPSSYRRQDPNNMKEVTKSSKFRLESAFPLIAFSWVHSELILNDGLSGVEGQGEGRLSPEDYRMTFLLGKILLLSKVRQFRQLEGRVEWSPCSAYSLAVTLPRTLPPPPAKENSFPRLRSGAEWPCMNDPSMASWVQEHISFKNFGQTEHNLRERNTSNPNHNHYAVESFSSKSFFAFFSKVDSLVYFPCISWEERWKH